MQEFERWWYPSDPVYFWTSKILLCRSPEASLALYAQALRALRTVNALAPLDRTKDMELAVLEPDPRPQSLFADVPQVAQSLAATNWLAILLAAETTATEDRAALEDLGCELQQFQMSCVHRGIEKCLLLVISAPADTPPTEAVARRRQQLKEIGMQRGIPVDFLPHPTAIAVDSQGFDRWVQYVLDLRDVVSRQIYARLDSDGVELTSAATDTGKGDALVRKRGEARLRKQRAEGSLLLKDLVNTVDLANSALDIYKATTDSISVAQCHELIASALYLWQIAFVSGSGSPRTPTSSANLPSGFDSLVKEALALRRTGGGLLQMLGPASDTTEQGERRSSRRPSLATNQSLDLGTAVLAKYREASTAYQKVSPAGMCVTNFLTATVLSLEDQLGALDVLTGILEGALKNNTVLGAHMAMLVAHKFQAVGASRKAILAIFLAAQKFVDHCLNTVTSSSLACAQDIVSCACELISQLDVAPLVRLCARPFEQGSPLLAAGTHQNIMKPLAEQIRLAYSVSRCKRSERPYTNTSVREGRNVYGWPSVQLVMADHLRKLTEYLKQPVASLWMGMVGFAAVANAFDSRTQTASQRTLASREATLSLVDRLVPVRGVDGVLIGYKSTPWMIPPSVSLVTKNESAAAKYLSKCYSGAVGVSVRRQANRSVHRYSHFGGLARGHYIPHLLSLEPRQGRRAGMPNFRSQLVSAGEGPKVTNEIVANGFLFRPWHNDDKRSVRRLSSMIGSAAACSAVWAVGDLHSVCVRVRNTLSTDILLDGCKLEMAGNACQCQPLTVGLPPVGYDMLFDCLVIPKAVGFVHFIGLSYFSSRIPTTQFLFKDTVELAEYFFNTRCKHKAKRPCQHSPNAAMSEMTSITGEVSPQLSVKKMASFSRAEPLRPQRSISSESHTNPGAPPRELGSLTLSKSTEEELLAHSRSARLTLEPSESSDSDDQCPFCEEADSAVLCDSCLDELLEEQQYSSTNTVLVVPELPKLTPQLDIENFGLESAVYEGETITATLQLTNLSSALDAELLYFAIRANDKSVGNGLTETSPLTGRAEKVRLRHGALNTDVPGLSMLWCDGVSELLDNDETPHLPGVKRDRTETFVIRFPAAASGTSLTVNIYYSVAGHSHWRWDALTRKFDCRKSLIVSLMPFYLASEDTAENLLVSIGVEHFLQDVPFSLIVRRAGQIVVDHAIPTKSRLTKVPLCVPRRWASAEGAANIQALLWQQILNSFTFEWRCGNRRGVAVTNGDLPQEVKLLRSISTYRRALTEVLPLPKYVTTYLVVSSVANEELLRLESNSQYNLPWVELFVIRLYATCKENYVTDQVIIQRTRFAAVPALQDKVATCHVNADFVVCGKLVEDEPRSVRIADGPVMLHQILIRILKSKNQPLALSLSSECELDDNLALRHSHISILLDKRSEV